MAKKVLFNLLLSCFLFAFLFAATALAQTNSCVVKMNVTSNESGAKVTGAAATALNTKTKRVYRSVLRNGMPYFAKLSEGDYRITVSKIGYKLSIDDFYVDCSEINVDYDALSIELYKGSSKQVVRLYNRTLLSTTPLRRAEADQYTEGTKNVSSSRSEAVISSNNQASASGESGSSTSRQDNNTPKTISGGVINGKATNLVKPEYPAAARAARASGAVNVQVTIDEEGNVIAAAAVSGHPLLRAAAVKAARESKFSPTLLEGQPVKVIGVIVYNFVP